MRAYRLIADSGRVYVEPQRLSIVSEKDVLIRIKYALLTDVDYSIILKKVKRRILSLLALGRIVDRGVKVPKNVIGKSVIVGPKCNSLTYVIDIDGLASSYVSAPIECIQEALVEDPYILIAPCINKILLSIRATRKRGTCKNIKYVLSKENILSKQWITWGFSPYPLNENVHTYVSCLDAYLKYSIDPEFLSIVKEIIDCVFVEIEREDLVEILEKQLKEKLVFIVF